MKVSLMAGVDASVAVKDWSWKQFITGVHEQSLPQKEESDETKKQAVSFSCCEYDPPHRRLSNIVEGSIWAIVLDLDRVMAPRQCLERLDRWRYIAWTTWSSQSGREKWRVVIPGRVDPAGLSRAVASISATLAGVAQVDPSSRDAAHLWFFPWHRWSQRATHKIWVNEGEAYGGGQLTVDFSNTSSTMPEKIGEGGRNTALHRYLGGSEGRACRTIEEFMDLAGSWNDRLSQPMTTRETRSIANKKWHWLQKNRPIDVSKIKIERWALGRGSVVAKLQPIVGDILYPGLTLVSAKMKEGKTFLVSQLAVALASGTAFLNGKEFAGFSVPEAKRVIMVAGEDNPQTIERRIVRNMKAGYLPEFPEGWLEIVFPAEIAKARLEAGKVDGVRLAEQLLREWYEEGFRVVMIDPLRAWEAGLGINEYPGTEGTRNVHTRDFLTTMWYNQLADRMPGLCILVSLHHGKNKRDHDASDPGDMIAGTTGLGAGAMTTISLLPKRGGGRTAEESALEEGGPKQRELYIHGRLTREKRLLVEQGDRTGLWSCLGDVGERGLTEVSEVYFTALRDAGGEDGWVTGEEVARRVGRRVDTVQRVLARMIKRGARLWGLAVIARRGTGYRLAA